ncbi:MAG: hypothetical protein V7K41_18010 [Nostoc sp.]
MMIEGKWTTDGNKSDPNDRFNETPTTFCDPITADGSSGFKAEAGRYHLYVSLACPWAHRTLIMREIKGLNDLISLNVSLILSKLRAASHREVIAAYS